MKVTLTKIFRTNTNKDGSPLISKAGKPYTRISIKTREHGDKYLSGFGNAENAQWREAQTVDIEVEEKGQYLNFSMPKKQVPSEKIEELREYMNARFAGLESKIFAIEQNLGIAPTAKTIDYPENEGEPNF